MRNIVIWFYITIFIIISGCTPILKTVEQQYQKTDFIPNMIDQEVMPKFTVTITPQDNIETDKETFIAAQRGGVSENEIIKSWENRLTNTPDKNARRIQGVFNEIDDLIKWNFLPSDVGYELKLQMINQGNYGDGSEVETLKDGQEVYPDTYNPYKINQRYLSVFKVVYNNETDNIINVSVDSFQIISGNEQLNPIKTDYYEKNLAGSSEKLKNVFRMNMTDNVTIVPHQSVTKYFAVPTVNLNEKKLIAKLIFNNTVFDFDFTVTRTQISKVFKFREFTIKGKDILTSTTLNNIVIKQGNRIYSLRSDKVYILTDLNSEPLSIYYTNFDFLESRYGKILDIKSSKKVKKIIKAPLWYFRIIKKSPNANYNSP